MTINDLTKEGLLFVAFCMSSIGIAAGNAKEYIAAGIFLSASAVLIVIRAILKKKGYIDTKNQDTK